MPHGPKSVEGMEKPRRARRRKRGPAKGDLKPPPRGLRRAGRPPGGGVGRACGEPPGRHPWEPSHRCTGRPTRGKGRACTREAKALGSTPSHHGVCGRHGGEEARVTPGDLGGSTRQVGSRAWDTCRRQGREQGTPTSPGSHREVGAERSGSEVPAEARPGGGAGQTTQERGHSTTPRIAAASRGAAGRTRSSSGGRSRALLRGGNAGKR